MPIRHCVFRHLEPDEFVVGDRGLRRQVVFRRRCFVLHLQRQRWALNFTGAGIVLWGGSTTINISNSGGVNFYNSSISGAATINNSGFLSFRDMSAAGNGTITNNYILSFVGNSFSGGTTIINNHLMAFQETSFAGAGTSLTNNSSLEFRNASRAGTGSSITNNANLYFKASSWAEDLHHRQLRQPVLLRQQHCRQCIHHQ